MRKIVSLIESIDHYLNLLSKKQEKNKADNPNCLWIKSYSLIDLKSDKDLLAFRKKLGDIKYLECLKYVVYKKDIFHEPVEIFKSVLDNECN